MNVENMVVDAVIEIPMGSMNKYEIDKESGKIRLDRVLFAAMRYPTEYGMQGGNVTIGAYHGRHDAAEVIRSCKERYQNTKQ